MRTRDVVFDGISFSLYLQIVTRARDVVFLMESLFLSIYKYVTRTEMLSIEADFERSKSLYVVKAISSVTNLHLISPVGL